MLHLETLTPQTKLEGVYLPLFRELKSSLIRDDVNNIGIIGRYGSGKSSFIESFLTWIKKKENVKNDKHKLRLKDKNILRLSLVHLNNYEIHESSYLKRLQSKELEECILKQILYSEKTEKIEDIGSVTSLSNKRKWISIFLFFILLFLSIFLFKLLIEYKNYTTVSIDTTLTENLKTKTISTLAKKKQFDLFNFKSFKFIFLCCLDLLSILLFFIVATNIAIKNRVKKIKLYSSEIEFENGTNGTPFNTYISDILYFFLKTKKRIVVIEDIDRFNNDEIFLHLKELNFIINNYPALKQKVKFFYLINDEIFPKEEKTKFFELIIPIIPISSSINMGNLLIQYRKTNKNEIYENSHESIEEQLNDDYLIMIGEYISDYRLMVHIWNEFKVYYHILEKNPFMNQEKLFSFIVVKNTYPGFNDSILNNCKLFNEVLDYKKEFLKKETITIYKQINEIESNEIKDTERELEDVSRHFLYLYSKFYLQESQYSEIKRYIEKEKITYTEFVIMCRRRSHFKPDIYSLVSQYWFNRLKDENGYSYTQRRDSIIDLNNSEKQKNKSMIEMKNEELKSIPFLSFKDVCEKYEQAFENFIHTKIVNNQNLEIISKVIDLLTNGIIDENYLVFSNIYYEGYLSVRDQKYINAIESKRNIYLYPDERIDNPFNVIHKLSSNYKDMIKARTCNFYILDVLFRVMELYEYGDFYNHYKNLFSPKKLSLLFRWYLDNQDIHKWEDIILKLSKFDIKFLERWFLCLDTDDQKKFVHLILTATEFEVLAEVPQVIQEKIDFVLSHWKTEQLNFTEEEKSRIFNRYKVTASPTKQ